MRKVILYIALSLDGYIADSQGGVAWLGGQNEAHQSDYGYGGFISGIDTIIMGYNTYHQVRTELSPAHWPYAGMMSYVLTHRQMEDADGIRFVNRPVHELVESLKQQDGKAIWICGGASVINPLIALDFIDEYHLSIMPVLLGNGLRLFDKQDHQLPLQLVSTSCENGVLDCVYQRRRP